MNSIKFFFSLFFKGIRLNFEKYFSFTTNFFPINLTAGGGVQDSKNPLKMQVFFYVRSFISFTSK